jgi:hypothetical protein
VKTPLPALLVSLIGCGLAFAPRSARAAGPLGPDGAPITTSDFGIDLFTGPVLGGSRFTGLAGAYAAIAEGVDGNLSNPATPAVRPFYSITPIDHWLGFGFTFPALTELDFFNTGERDADARLPSSFLYLTPAANFQWQTVGVGLTLELQQFSLPAATVSGKIVTRLTTSHFHLANAFLDGQIALGIGARNVSMSASDDICDGEGLFDCVRTEVRRKSRSFSSDGFGPELGILVKPNGLPFRAGAAYRAAVDTDPRLGGANYGTAEGDIVITGANGELFYLPRRVSLPWDLNLGFAFQFGRVLNTRWRTPREAAGSRLQELEAEQESIEDARERELESATGEAERERVEARFDRLLRAQARLVQAEHERGYLTLQQEFAEWERFYVLVTTSLMISGSVPSAVGIESYFDQEVVRSGTETSYSPHFGLETEAVPDVLRLRTGGYVEPARSSGSSARGHVTVGGDVRLGGFDVFGFWPDDYAWSFSTFADMSPRYATFGFSIGGWYPRHSGRVDDGASRNQRRP